MTMPDADRRSGARQGMSGRFAASRSFATAHPLTTVLIFARHGLAASCDSATAPYDSDRDPLRCS